MVGGILSQSLDTVLDKLIPCAKVAHRGKKQNFRVEILPNPSGGVNTHLWSSEAYIVGIVPVAPPFYSCSVKQCGQSKREEVCFIGFCVFVTRQARHPGRF